MNLSRQISSGLRPLLPKAIVCALVIATIHSSQANPPLPLERNQLPLGSWNSPSPDEDQRINAVLATYTRAVSEGNAALFESQLLDLKIPFAAVRGELAASTNLATIQDYAGFKKSIFESGKKFKQRFSNIKIEQRGAIAQVSLDYETALQGADYDRKGWKVLHLLKVGDQWKIASEFYASYGPR